MSCYNSITWRCPHCGTINEIQSKASDYFGSCDINNIPDPDTQRDVDEDTHYCSDCGRQLQRTVKYVYAYNTKDNQ